MLQIPPPKPPPPEMHFIPNPSNTDFVYLLGLETVVDYLTVNKKANAVAAPFRCAQCKIDFTPVWKWEKQSKLTRKKGLNFKEQQLIPFLIPQPIRKPRSFASSV